MLNPITSTCICINFMPLTKKFVFRIVGEHLRRGLDIFKERSAVSSDGLKDCTLLCCGTHYSTKKWMFALTNPLADLRQTFNMKSPCFSELLAATY